MGPKILVAEDEPALLEMYCELVSALGYECLQATDGDEAVAVARRLSHLPVLVNPSLAAGQAEIVADLALAATATGCEGVLIDADTPDVDGAVSHRQALSVDLVTQLVPRLKRTRAAIVG